MKYKLNIIYLTSIALATLAVIAHNLTGAQAQATHRAGLVVRFGDGSVITRCVEFSEPEITGYDLLQRSGLTVAAAFDSGAGAAVCAIEGQGCPVSDCFCAFPPDFWSYWFMTGGQWQFNSIGASTRKLRGGDVDGWSWGGGTAESGTAPPLIPFDQICAPPPPPATDTPPPLPTPTPAPTSTPEPVVWFRLDQNPIPAGSCTLVRWDTNGLRELYLDGEPVGANGSREVCPAAHQKYTLRVVTNGGDEQTHLLELGVTGNTPVPQATPTTRAEQVLPTATPPPPPTVQPTTAVPPTLTSTPTPSATPLPPSEQGQPAVTETTTPSPAATVAPTAQAEPARPTATSPPIERVSPSPTESQVAVAAAPADREQGGRALAEQGASDSSGIPASYFFFGALVVVLVAVLIGLQVSQRRSNTAE